jgi:hypothetical protein
MRREIIYGVIVDESLSGEGGRRKCRHERNLRKGTRARRQMNK